MPNYKETEVSGTEYRRARLLQIINDRLSVPSIAVYEERVISFGDQTIGQDCDRLSADFDPSAEFPRIDVATGEPTGEMYSQSDIYDILHSLYRHLAKIRDDAAI